jgi:hypothetical protein
VAEHADAPSLAGGRRDGSLALPSRTGAGRPADELERGHVRARNQREKTLQYQKGRAHFSFNQDGETAAKVVPGSNGIGLGDAKSMCRLREHSVKAAVTFSARTHRKSPSLAIPFRPSAVPQWMPGRRCPLSPSDTQ